MRVVFRNKKTAPQPHSNFHDRNEVYNVYRGSTRIQVLHNPHHTYKALIYWPLKIFTVSGDSQVYNVYRSSPHTLCIGVIAAANRYWP